MITNIIYAIIYGIIEGISEWLPISSTGHLIIANYFFPFINVNDGFIELFDVVIQLGAVFAVFFNYFDKLNPFKCSSKNERKEVLHLWLLIVIGLIPSIVFGLLLNDFIDEHLFNVITVSIMLLIYGFVFLFISNRKNIKFNSVNKLDYKTCFIIGMAQVLSLIPGTSRSGVCIIACLFLGLSKKTACEYSFLLALPTIFGASILKILKFLTGVFIISPNEILLILVGTITAFLVSLLVIKKLLDYVSGKSFFAFGVYRIILAMILILFFI